MSGTTNRMKTNVWQRIFTMGVVHLTPLVFLGCSSTPKAQTSSPAASQSHSENETPDPPDVRKGLSSWKQLMSDAWLLKEPTPKQDDQKVVPFGKGVITIIRPKVEARSQTQCVYSAITDINCKYFRIALFSDIPKDRYYYTRLWTPPLPHEKWSPMVHLPQPGISVVPGESEVYLYGGLNTMQIYTIDMHGKISSLYANRNVPSMTKAKILTTSYGRLIIGQVPTEKKYEWEYQIRAPPEELLTISLTNQTVTSKFKAHQPQNLEIGIANTTAREARIISSHPSRASFGTWDAITLLDKETKRPSDQVVLAWTEVIPPPYRFPRAQIERKKKWGSKNSCGGSGRSRSLWDWSVGHKTHLTRLNRSGKIESDKVIKLPNASKKIDTKISEKLRERGYWNTDGPYLNLTPTEYGFDLNGIAFNHDGTRNTDHLPPEIPQHEYQPPVHYIESPPNILSSHYDRAGNQGMVVYEQSEKIFALRFSALGERIGIPIEIQTDTKDRYWPKYSLFYLNKQWGYYERNNQILSMITGEHAGKMINYSVNPKEIANRRKWWLLPKDNDHLLIIQIVDEVSNHDKENAEDCRKQIPYVAEFTLSTQKKTNWRRFPTWMVKKGTQGYDYRIEQMSTIEDILLGTDRTIRFLGHNVNPEWFHLVYHLDSGKWEQAVPMKTQVRTKNVRIYPLWNDNLAVLKDDNLQHFFWIKQQKSVSVSNRKVPDKETFYPSIYGHMIVPAQPDQVIPLGEYPSEKGTVCPYAFRTGERRVVFVCTQAPSSTVPHPRLVTKVFRY
jgi:hypothetical protein